MDNRFGILVIGFILLIGAGCTHSMQVKKLNDYAVAHSSGTRMDVAVAPFNGDADATMYYRAIETALRSHPHVGQLRNDWADDKAEPDFNPSHVVELDISPAYEGSGWNYPITFPGFLLFICAWNGYVYHADAKTEITVASLENAEGFLETTGLGTEPRSENVEMHFSLRHCDFERGFWSGSGWWFPGWGLHNIITGAVFIKYDPDATQPFHDVVDQKYGEYVAEKIICLMKQCGAEQYAVAARQGVPAWRREDPPAY